MNYNIKQSKPFEQRMNRYRMDMPAAWIEELHNYVVHGFVPGSFHRYLYNNNLYGATRASDSFNKWNWIVTFMEALAEVAPQDCWGSEEKVARWLALSTTVRHKYCHKHKLILTPQELTWDIIENSE